MSTHDNVLIKQIGIGPMANFAYFIGDAKTKEIAVVDPGWECAKLLSDAKDEGLKIVAILLTHGHGDHTNSVEELLEEIKVPVYVSEKEPVFFRDKRPLKKLVDGEMIKIGNIEIQSILTPGHSPGSMCFKCGHILITGDTLFIDGCGRCDLPGGNPKQMYHSLYNILMKLPDETVIYSGHQYGPSSFATLESQKKTNPYLTCSSEHDFLTCRMGF